MSYRTTNVNTNLVSMSFPKASVGCNGIDVFLGSFSMINGDQLVQVARGIAVGDHAVRASVAGFDLSIQTFQLTTRYLEYAHERYYTGQKLRVVIQNIRRNDEGKVIGIDVSGRLAEMEEMRRHIHRVALHETCFATITNIPNPKRNGNENSERPVVAHPWLYLDHFDLPARAMRVRTDAMTQPLKSGDNVLLYVTRIDEDHGIVIGDIVRRIGRKEATL